MGSRLPADDNPYSERNPFAVLGVSPSATPKEVQEAQHEKMEEIDYAGLEDHVRIAKRQEISKAYEAIRDARARAAAELFVFDSAVGRQELTARAEANKKFSFDFGRIPRAGEGVFPNAPQVPDARAWYREPSLERSTRLQTDGQLYDLEPKVDALDSISFDL